MCLFSVKKEEDEDIRVSRRVTRRTEVDRYRAYSPRRRSYSPTRRSSRVSIRTSQPTIVIPPPAPLPLPPPTGKVLPIPQPIPQFESPPLSPPEVHYVHVSPRSSLSDHSDYRYERREVRYERDVSPARSHRGGDRYEYRYVDSAPEPEPRYRRERSRSRARSRSRGRYDDEDDEYDRTNVRLSRKVYADRDGYR
jgi:hypothetical protein